MTLLDPAAGIHRAARCRKYILPTQFTRRIGIFASKRRRKVDLTKTSLQFKFIAADDGHGLRRDQRFTPRRGKEDGRQSAVSFLAGIAEDQQMISVLFGESQGQGAG